MKPQILFFCNVDKDKDSLQFAGIFTNRKKLNVALNEMLKDGDIKWSGESEDGKSFMGVNKYTIDELKEFMSYICFEDFNINEIYYQ